MPQLNGSCLCKKVSITISPEHKVFDACHCGMCRKWNGGPAFAVESGKEFKIEGKESVQIYSSSDWAERSFCKHCGTHLYYHLKNTEFYSFFLGFFDKTEDFNFKVQIYVDAKPKNYDFANKTEMMTEAEVIAKFSSGNQ